MAFCKDGLSKLDSKLLGMGPFPADDPEEGGREILPEDLQGGDIDMSPEPGVPEIPGKSSSHFQNQVPQRVDKLGALCSGYEFIRRNLPQPGAVEAGQGFEAMDPQGLSFIQRLVVQIEGGCILITLKQNAQLLIDGYLPVQGIIHRSV